MPTTIDELKAAARKRLNDHAAREAEQCRRVQSALQAEWDSAVGRAREALAACPGLADHLDTAMPEGWQGHEREHALMYVRLPGHADFRLRFCWRDGWVSAEKIRWERGEYRLFSVPANWRHSDDFEVYPDYWLEFSHLGDALLAAEDSEGKRLEAVTVALQAAARWEQRRQESKPPTVNSRLLEALRLFVLQESPQPEE